MTETTEPQQRPIVTRARAMAAGTKTYFTGIPCSRGHIAERCTANGTCAPCAKINNQTKLSCDKEAIIEAVVNRLTIYTSAVSCPTGHFERYVSNKDCAVCALIYREANRDQEAARSREWYSNNPERSKAQHADYYLTNKDAVLAKNRIWHINNVDRVRANQVLYALSHKAETKAYQTAWRLANPLRRRVNNQNREARKRANGGYHTANQIRHLFNQQRGRCAYFRICKNHISYKENGFHEDHIVAISQGGSNWINNIQLTCGPCNMKKRAKDPLVFARQLGLLL